MSVSSNADKLLSQRNSTPFDEERELALIDLQLADDDERGHP